MSALDYVIVVGIMLAVAMLLRPRVDTYTSKCNCRYPESWLAITRGHLTEIRHLHAACRRKNRKIQRLNAKLREATARANTTTKGEP